MRLLLVSILVACVPLAACNSDRGRGNVANQDLRAAEILASKNVDCAFEDVKFCAHMIEKRSILPQFFTPDVGKISEEEKKRGRRLLTEEVVDAASKIQQCRKIQQPSIPLIPNMRINRQDYNLMATSPVGENSTCYLTVSEG